MGTVLPLAGAMGYAARMGAGSVDRKRPGAGDVMFTKPVNKGHLGNVREEARMLLAFTNCLVVGLGTIDFLLRKEECSKT